MKTQLPSPHTEIVAQINALFPVVITSLRFVPAGESSWLYAGTRQDQPDVAIKIQKDVDAISSEVLAHLARYDFKWMPQVVLSNAGNLWEQSDGLFYSVQQYIEPEMQFHAGPEPNVEYLQELGKMLHSLHEISIDDAALKDVPREVFHPPILDDAKMTLARLKSVDASDKSILGIQAKLAGLLPGIEQSFSRLEQYGNELARQNHDFVLCHGDLHFGNTIQAKDDELYIVDWDEASIALPEFDLKYMSDQQITEISKGYGSDLPNNPVALMYYRNLLIVRATWFWINRLLDAEPAERPGIAVTILEILGHNSLYMLRALK